MTTLLTIDETAERLRCHRTTVYKLIREHKIRLTKVRGSSFVKEQEVERYLRNAERSAA